MEFPPPDNAIEAVGFKDFQSHILLCGGCNWCDEVSENLAANLKTNSDPQIGESTHTGE